MRMPREPQCHRDKWRHWTIMATPTLPPHHCRCIQLKSENDINFHCMCHSSSKSFSSRFQSYCLLVCVICLCVKRSTFIHQRHRELVALPTCTRTALPIFVQLLRTRGSVTEVRVIWEKRVSNITMSEKNLLVAAASAAKNRRHVAEEEASRRDLFASDTSSSLRHR